MSDFENVGFYLSEPEVKPTTSYYFEDKNLLIAKKEDITDTTLSVYKLFLGTILENTEAQEFYYKNFLDGNGSISKQLADVLFSYMSVFVQLYSVNQKNYEMSERIKKELSDASYLQLESFENSLVMLKTQLKSLAEIVDNYYRSFIYRDKISADNYIIDDYMLFGEYIRSFLQDKEINVSMENIEDANEHLLYFIKDTLAMEVDKEVNYVKSLNTETENILVVFIRQIDDFINMNTEKSDYVGSVTVDDYLTKRYQPRTVVGTVEPLEPLKIFMIKHLIEFSKELSILINRIKDINYSKLHIEDEYVLRFGNESILGYLTQVQVLIKNSEKSL